MQAYLIYLLYWALQILASPLLLLYLALRILRNRAYVHGLAERFGFLPRSLHRTAPGAVWLHAVSVGEAITAVALIRRLRAELPFAPVYVSCATLAGRAMAAQKLKDLAAGVFYAPLDYRSCVRRVLRALKPSLVIVMETEIWPNLYRDARRSGARLLIVNGRISDHALPRYLRFAWFFRAVLPWPDAIYAQDPTSAARYLQLGAPAPTSAGNLKYDFDPSATSIAPPVQALLNQIRPSHIWIAASTMPPAAPGDPDEDDVVLDAFQQLASRLPGLLLILVPRRPERFDEAAAKLAARALPFLRRSQLQPGQPLRLPGVLLLDTIGELSGLFAAAHCVFMGGTFPQRGGHNLLEPAAFGVPVVTGPHMENFSEIAAEFRRAQAVVTVDRPSGLAAAVEALLLDEPRRRALGQRGRHLSDLRRGATARAAARAAELYDAALPTPARFQPLAALWLTGVAIHRAFARLSPDLPPAPTISVGNLAMGGAGKTPLVLWLCEQLAAAGRKPAVLTRGYRRRSARHPLALLPGQEASVEETGEEAQLILRAGHAALAIGAGRHAARLALERICQPDIYLLDDGFQHWQTRRDLDIVLIDALDPFRGGVFPHGRLREPFSALRRAGAVVITRTHAGRAYTGLRAEILRHNPAVPIFLARTTATLPPIPPGLVPGAFCGLGQPSAFLETLRGLGCQPAFFQAFPDHHHYAEPDLAPLAARAPMLLTTEKDFLNLPPGLAARLNIHAVPSALEVPGGARLLELVLRASRP